MKFNLSKDLDKKIAQERFNKMLSKGSKIELKEFRFKRTLDQNRYLHVCIAYVCLDTGYTREEAKIVLKREYGLVYDKAGVKFLRSTKDLDTKECADFIEWIRNFSLDNGSYIPTPEEYLENQFEIEKEFEKIL